MQRRTNDKFAQTVTSCLCSTRLFLALKDELFVGEKTGSLSGKDLRIAKGRDFKTYILLLVYANPNEQSHCPSVCAYNGKLLVVGVYSMTAEQLIANRLNLLLYI